ncbi:MAG: AlkA N-terminal domain-containing protein [Kiloniellales bacterium]|nr:AlkA N-terminal domain-containing protein [Kiloniellales bacterium]
MDGRDTSAGAPQLDPHLDPRACEAARLARDRRFDGRFFVGVVTTGIFCRPVCPVRPPKAENVRFYPSAAAAAEAGFRPCLRCRPESAPGTPAWLGTEATVARALRLIEEGALDGSAREGGSVECLAARLGLGARQLRRLFRRHLGASPLGVAQTRRLLFAKSLLTDTALPLAEVAEAAGFGSLRRFNAALKRAYGRPPGQLRRASRGAAAATSGDGAAAAEPLRLALPLREPYAWPGLLGYLEARATPGVEAVAGGAYRRSLTLDGEPAWVAVTRPSAEPALRLEVSTPGARGLLTLVNRLRRMFDTDADPQEIAAHLGRDAVLSDLVAARPGLRLPGAWDGFELGVRAILGQQVTVKGATTLAGRLAAAFGAPMDSPEVWGPNAWGLTRRFPTPACLAECDPGVVGLPKARARAIRAFAAAVRDGALAFDGSQSARELAAALTALPGIGRWTADYITLRALGDPDAFPAGDLGLIRAARRLGIADDESSLRTRAEAWRPWRAYAAQYLWLSDLAAPDAKPARRTERREARARDLHAPG